MGACESCSHSARLSIEGAHGLIVIVGACESCSHCARPSIEGGHGLEQLNYQYRDIMNVYCKVVASHAAVARSIPLRCTDLYYARGALGVLPMRVGVRPVNWIYRL